MFWDPPILESTPGANFSLSYFPALSWSLILCMPAKLLQHHDHFRLWDGNSGRREAKKSRQGSTVILGMQVEIQKNVLLLALILSLLLINCCRLEAQLHLGNDWVFHLSYLHLPRPLSLDSHRARVCHFHIIISFLFTEPFSNGILA